MHVSHETIYRSLFIQARGVLRKELMEHLRSKRRMRRSRHASEHGHSRGQIVDAISIRERPAEAEDRAIPGHWEGDLLAGGKNSDPQSPWQRGTNENTNLLLRQYFPRGTDLAPITQAQLDQVELRLNQRPRKTLGFQTPASKLQASVASTVWTGIIYESHQVREPLVKGLVRLGCDLLPLKDACIAVAFNDGNLAATDVQAKNGSGATLHRASGIGCSMVDDWLH
jgi:hypothetical protein